jgi:hypothetical protein
MREVVAGLRLIPVGLEGGTNEINSIARLPLHKIVCRDIACIDEMVLWKQFPLGQTRMDCREDSLVTEGSLPGLDMGDQLWSIFLTGLSEMHLEAHP